MCSLVEIVRDGGIVHGSNDRNVTIRDEPLSATRMSPSAVTVDDREIEIDRGRAET